MSTVAGAGALAAAGEVPKMASPDQPLDGARSLTDEVVGLARMAVERHVRREGCIDDPPALPGLPERAGAFVTIRERGELRGCVGSIEPVEATVGQEIVRSAILAATQDPRFRPIVASELPRLAYSVSILEPPEEIDSTDQLNPAIYGLIVESGDRRALLLPGIRGIDTVEEQVAVTRRKGGIAPDAPVRLSRFRTTHYSEHAEGD